MNAARTAQPLREDGQSASVDAVAYNQALVLRRTGPFISVVTILAAALFVAGFWQREPTWLLLTWFAGAFLPFFYLLAIYIRRRGQVRADEVARILWRAKVVCSYVGLYWAVAVGVFFTLESIPHLFLLAIAIGAMTAGAAGIYHVLMPACLALILPPLLALGGAFALAGTPPHILTGVMILLYGAVFLAIAYYGYRRFAALIRAETGVEAARADLADAMDSSASAVGFFDGAGAPLFLNENFRALFGEDWPRPVPGEDTVRQSADGRWVKSSCTATRRGGFIAVHTDITALKHQEDELRRARDEAESASRMKSQFLAMMSHELRTPLNSVIGFSEILEQMARSRQADTEVEYAQTIRQSGRHLLQMIRDILDISKIEAGQYELRPEWLALEDRLRGVIGKLQAQARAAGVTLETALEAAPAEIWADGQALEQILLKLVGNAVKFTPRGGHVAVAAEPAGEGVAITVADTGEGIEEAFKSRVVDPFVQSDASISRKSGGAGLGLPIVQRLVALHGGRFTLTSEPGEGTAATIVLPDPSVQPEGTAPSADNSLER